MIVVHAGTKAAVPPAGSRGHEDEAMNGDLSGANALRLMGALIKSGAEADVPIANARVNDVAVQAGLDGDELERALLYAGEQGWMETGENPGWTHITEAGISAGQGNG
jgi:hypothetical protein